MLWILPALLGGRTPRELMAADPDDFNVLPGLLAMMALGMFFCCQYLFWSSFAHRASNAMLIASFCTLLYGTLYWSLLRVLDDAGWFTRTLVIAVLASLTAFNAYLAGHELLLLAYEPQVQAQAERSASRDALAFAAQKEVELGLPDLKQDERQLRQQLGEAQAQAVTVNPAVTVLLEQTRQCETEASQLQGHLVGTGESAGLADARQAWHRKTADCRHLGKLAQARMLAHEQQWQAQVQELQSRLVAMQKRVQDTLAGHAQAVQRAGPGIAAAHASGAGRYDALWKAVAERTVPAWSAYGLMFFSIVLDSAGLVFKLLQAPDAMARRRRHEAGMAQVEAKTLDHLLSQLMRGAKDAARSASGQLQSDFSQYTRTTLTAETVNHLEAQAFERIHGRTARAQQRTGQPLPSLLRRMRTALDGIHSRALGRFQAPGPGGAAV